MALIDANFLRTANVRSELATDDSQHKSVNVYSVQKELKLRKWGAKDLSWRPKGDQGKVAIAMRLRAETAMTVKWIAERLQMGSPGFVNHLLYRSRKPVKKKYPI